MRAKVFILICFCFIPLTSHAAAIHNAAKAGDVTAITAALDAGAEVNDVDQLGEATALYSLSATRRWHCRAIEGERLAAAFP